MKVFPVSRGWVKPGLVVSTAALVLGAGAAAAFESDTVGSYGRGLWWAVSLMTTVGFVGQPPRTTEGAVLSVFLMLTGFLLLSLVSAALASLFVKEDEAPVQHKEAILEQEILSVLSSILQRLESLENARADADSPVARDDE